MKIINRIMGGTIKKMLDVFNVVTLTGPRQSGKTTICRMMFPKLPYVNLEDQITRTEVESDIRGFFSRFPDGLIIDEAQHMPELFSQIQVLTDDDKFNGRARKFILTGSSNFQLMERITQSLAGRTAVLTLLPVSLDELSGDGRNVDTDQLILNGGYPAVWQNEKSRSAIIGNYYNTYVERDLRTLLNIKDLRAFQMFMRLCAGRIGTEFNASALSNEVGVSVKTIQNWTSVLASSYVVHMLPPYFANISKRLVKTPKLYFHDTGLACHLLGISELSHLQTHPLRGSLFENLVINEQIKKAFNKGVTPNLYFYRDKSQHEVDLLCEQADKLIACEIKSSQSYTKEYFKQLEYLKGVFPDRLIQGTVLYDGKSAPNLNLYNYRTYGFDFV